MQTEKRTLTLDEWINLILWSALILGGIVRFLPGILAGFPLNDGGMFLRMVKDLHATHYLLPEFTSYNYTGIPFAYPPLGFYFARLISDLFFVPEITLFRWLPPLIHVLTIWVFYMLAVELSKSKKIGALSAAFYALTPGAFGWFIMGGGLTRSFGSLFLLLTLYSVLRLFQSGEKKYIFLSILFGGLTITSHPEAGIHAAATCILAWFFFGYTFRSFINAVIVGIGVLLITSPWWASVLFYHGFSPILSAMHTGSNGTSIWGVFYNVFTDSGAFPILIIFRIAGVIWGASKRYYFFLIWTFLPYLIEPRSAPSVSFYPMTILIALIFAEAIPWLMARVRGYVMQEERLHQNPIYNIALLSLLMVIFIDSCLYGYRLVGNSLKSNDLEAMYWVKQNTPTNAVFITVTGISSAEIDPFIEWLPALGERQNLSTLQGYEWLLADDFYKFHSELSELQQCVSVDCVEDWAKHKKLSYNYVAVFKTQTTQIDELFVKDQNYQLIYSNDDVAIFNRK